MTSPTRYSVILDPLGMANVVSDREPGPGAALWGLTGSWDRATLPEEWLTFSEAVKDMRWWNQSQKPARPAERAGE